MMKSIVPESSSGAWRVEKFAVTKDEAALFNMRASWKPGFAARTPIAPGTYTRLVRGTGTVVMSDTPAEVNDHRWFVDEARGRVLINGLGLGVCLQMVLAKPEVDQVTVIEIARPVIALVASCFKDERLRVIEADALKWRPPRGERFDAVWHDIWDDITADNLPEMRTLHRAYGRRAAWQGSWCRELCEMYR